MVKIPVPYCPLSIIYKKTNKRGENTKIQVRIIALLCCFFLLFTPTGNNNRISYLDVYTVSSVEA